MTPGLARASIPFISARVAAAPDDSDCSLYPREGLRRSRKTANEKGVIRERTTPTETIVRTKSISRTAVIAMMSMMSGEERTRRVSSSQL